MIINRQKQLILPAAVTVLILLGAIGGCFGSDKVVNQAKTAQVFKDIPVEEAYELIKNHESNANFAIIDVRTPGEYSAGHIAGAVNIDNNSGTFRNELNKLDKHWIYLVYCRSGNRSRSAATIMKEMGFTEVYNALGGIVQWEEKGYPTIKESD